MFFGVVMDKSKMRLIYNMALIAVLYGMVAFFAFTAGDGRAGRLVLNVGWVGIVAMAYMRMFPIIFMMVLCLTWMVLGSQWGSMFH